MFNFSELYVIIIILRIHVFIWKGNCWSSLIIYFYILKIFLKNFKIFILN
jgi:hypothetical protein